MSDARFINYFDYFEIDPDASREENYRLLAEKRLKLGSGPSGQAKLDAQILDEATAKFYDQGKYEVYRKQWEQRQPGGAETGTRSQPAAGRPETEAAAGSSPKGLKAALLEIGASALKSALERKMSPERAGAGPMAGLTGAWRDSAGCVLQIQQSGGNIVVVVMNGFGQVVSQGRGVINGSVIDYQARDSAGQFGQGVLRVAPDGSRIEGQITWYNGFNVPTGSGQVYLVRS